MKTFRQITLITLVTYLLAEVTCLVAIKIGFIQAKVPQFFSDPRDTLIFPFTYADISPYWGTWHYNYPVKAPYGCLQTECIPNSAGARDKERTITGLRSDRIIVLGDSFMEGFGVKTEERVTDLLEKHTNREFLNFACPDMGSTQEYLVYKHLASHYDHNTVMIGLLPANDFLNDNITFDSIQTPLRYKPYWENDGTIKYYVENIQQSQFNYEAYKKYKVTFKYKVRYFLENTTCWFNIFYVLKKKNAAINFVKTKTSDGSAYSGYYDYSSDELSRLKQSLLAIKSVGTGKRLIVFTIPVKEDFIRYKTQPLLPLVKDLQAFASHHDIEYYDLLSNHSEENPSQLYFSCDEHWNAHGNGWAYKKLLHLFK